MDYHFLQKGRAQCWNFRTISGGQEPSRFRVVVPARQQSQEQKNRFLGINSASLSSLEARAGILEQSVGARNRFWDRAVAARQTTYRPAGQYDIQSYTYSVPIYCYKIPAQYDKLQFLAHIDCLTYITGYIGWRSSVID